jgi:hypothetical protein
MTRRQTGHFERDAMHDRKQGLQKEWPQIVVVGSKRRFKQTMHSKSVQSNAAGLGSAILTWSERASRSGIARGYCKQLSPTSSVPPRRPPGLFFAAGPVGPSVAPAIGSGARVREWTAAWVNRCLARVLVVPGRTSSGQMLHVCATGVVALLCSAPVRVGPNSISGDIGGRRP